MIKTWQQRCEEHPDHEGIVSEAMIRQRMQEEIDELRQREWVGLTDEEKQWFKGLGLVGVEIIESKLKERNS